MNTFILLLRFLRQRSIATTLTVLSVALGVALTASILTLRTESERAFSQKDTGFEVIVGAKGSPLQLVLNTMYHIGTPVGNIPRADAEKLQRDKRVKTAIPMVFGDNVGGFKVIGTTDEFFTRFEYRKNTRLALQSGTAFRKNYEAVLGAEAAQILGLKQGDSITVQHGIDVGEAGAHEHGKMPVVGVLAPSGTALDKGVYMTMYTVWDTHYHEYLEQQEAAEQVLQQQEARQNGTKQKEPDHDHEGHDHDHEGHDHAKDDHEEHTHEIPPEFSTITTLVVKLKSPVFYDSFVRSVNDGTSAQAALPIREISGLFAIVGNVNGVLLGVSYMVIIVAAMAFLAALYNSLNERRREIAILRSLGAHRQTILTLILAEAGFIGIAGYCLGIIVARCVFFVGKERLAHSIGTRLDGTWFYGFDAWIGAGVVALSLVVALLPAWQAYRTDVAQNLVSAS
ncbi:MAG: ABC transporter permease [Candidatus Kapaibacterium sp.]|nr:MAG: ABC transporter permease [Candidatus Kapabacteria bacterium]